MTELTTDTTRPSDARVLDATDGEPERPRDTAPARAQFLYLPDRRWLLDPEVWKNPTGRAAHRLRRDPLPTRVVRKVRDDLTSLAAAVGVYRDRTDAGGE